jgi:ribosome-binding protein aMBF1 (putative translation factor)
MNKNKPTTNAVEIMHKLYIKGDKKRLAYIEQEKARLEIAQKIYELRTQANLTQKELAHRIGTKQSVISRLEDADYDGYTLKMLDKIAEAVHCYVRVEFVPQSNPCACVS